MKTGRLTLTFLFAACCALAQTPSQSKLGSISGTVTDATTQQTITKAVVTLLDTKREGDEKDRSRTVTTDATGHYEFKDVSAGRYVVSAARPGFMDSSYGENKARHKKRMVPVSLSEGQTLSGIDIKLQRGAVISGRVVNEDGDPISGAQLWAGQYRNIMGKRELLPSGYAQSDDRGEYRIHDLEPGEYYVSCNVDPRSGIVAAGSDNRAYPSIFYPNAVSAEAATPVKVAVGGEEVANFDLVAVPSHTVRGRVVGVDDPNVHIALVSAVSPWSANYGVGATPSKDGSFEVKNVLPGKYWLTAFHFSEGKQDIARKKITVADTDLNAVTVSFEASNVEMHGSIRLLGNTTLDVTKISVNLVPAISPANSDDSEDDWKRMIYARPGAIKKDGSFTITAEAGSRRVFAAAYSRFGGFEDWYLKSVFFGGRDVTDTGFSPSAGADIQMFLSADGAEVSGVVTDKDGHPAPGATVVSIPEESRQSRRDLYTQTIADQLGRFRLRGVAPGQYKVFAFDDLEDQSYYDPEFLKQYSSFARDVKVEEKGKYSIEVKTVVERESGKDTR